MKKCFLCSVLIVACCFEGFSQTPVWTQMSGSPDGTTRHDDMVFVNETTGFSARGRGGIFKTTDAGQTWVQKLNMPTTHFRAIGFLSESHGFAGNLGPGSYDGNVTDTNLLYQTTDGGETWTVVPGINETGMKGFCALHVLDGQHIYGGGRVRGPAHFAKSEDGGTNWTVVDLKAAGVMGGIMDVYFKDPMHGFVIGMDTNEFFPSCGGHYHGRIARTTDGGATWTAVADTALECSYFWKMSWPTPMVGYVSLQQNATTTAENLIFYKTTDGGTTWISNGIPYATIGIPSFSLLQGIGFINENEGWVGGPSSATSYNFLHSTNGGASWTPVAYNDSRSINRIRFYPKFGVASGAELHIYKIPLAIANSPQSQTNAPGSSVALDVTAYGTPPLTFQWRFNGTNIPGATTNAYSIADFQPANAGNYDVMVGDFSGSVTSAVAVLSLTGAPTIPQITTQPRDQTVYEGSPAIFAVEADGTAPLIFQWRYNGANIVGQTNTTFVIENARTNDTGNYSVIVTNIAGSVTSDVVALKVIVTNGVLFMDDFDSFSTPIIVTNTGSTNGYKIVYRSISSRLDFKAIFGFDYSIVNFPKSIPPAPNSANGITKGLFLTVNKDTTAGAAAVNLYPTNQFFNGDFSLKFDMWINWANINTSTEHTLFGINHSGNATNRVGQPGSDGLFFGVAGDDDSTSTSPVLRDYSVFRGGGIEAPILMTTNNTTFGPAPLLSTTFENYDAGFVNLFPSQTIEGFGSTPTGSAGLRWIQAEVRQKRNLITWLLNGTIVAQYTNSFGYTNGNIMLGYNDHFNSIGDSNNFVILDNVRVEPVIAPPLVLLSPDAGQNGFSFGFSAEAGETYWVEQTTNLAVQSWTTYTNVTGSGLTAITVPASEESERYFRVRKITD